MTNFELFTLIYFVLDAEYDSLEQKDEDLMHFISELNPFIWKEESSADPAYFEEFCQFMKDKKLGDDLGYSIAIGYLKTEYCYKKAIDYFLKTSLDEWKDAVKAYLAEPHKGDGKN